MKKNKDKYFVGFLLLIAIIIFVSAYSFTSKNRETQSNLSFKYSYGVFLSCDNSNLDQFKEYKIIVIDAAYFSATDIHTLQSEGHTVYSYLNIGSLESFRSYYNQFYDITLAPYENWEEERWIDVSNTDWQHYIVRTVATEYLSKGIDGFFVDNCDIYYQYPTAPIFNGVKSILQKLMAMKVSVIINGGDTFVSKYLDKYNNLSDIMTGVNQETVFSKINFDTGSFSANTKDETQYFSNYVEKVFGQGCQVFLLEYTKDETLIDKIQKYCHNHHFYYYISDSIELN
jgi:cysteinyl-tRNA synthetase, unknown class